MREIHLCFFLSKCLCGVHKFSDNSGGDYWGFCRCLRCHHLRWSYVALQV